MDERYRRLREIGRGGMGAVYLAEDTVLHRHVAMKRVGMLPGQVAPVEERVLREARTLAALQHPNVVAVYDLVQTEDAHWLVMEYVESVNLNDLVQRDGPLPVQRVAPLLAQVSDALCAAHLAGIVHRDVKPGNILVGVDGVAKIADFGIARGTYDAALTQTGLLTGSPAYLAPEVAQGAKASTAADVWGLGATAYYALTGEQPYRGTDAVSTLYHVIHDPPPHTDRAGALGPAVTGMLTKDPLVRWSMSAVRDFAVGVGTRAGSGSTQELETLAPIDPDPGRHALDQDAKPATARTRRAERSGLPWMWVVLGTVLGGLLLVIASALWPREQGAGQNQGAAKSPASASSTPSTGESGGSGTAATAAELESFVRGYLTDVAADPTQTWPRLTPEFQKASGGFGKYRKFWEPISSAEIGEVTADPERMTVSYAVTYTREDGSTFDSRPTLQLVRQGEALLIAGEQ